jgi:hypothetical protein
MKYVFANIFKIIVRYISLLTAIFILTSTCFCARAEAPAGSAVSSLNEWDIHLLSQADILMQNGDIASAELCSDAVWEDIAKKNLSVNGNKQISIVNLLWNKVVFPYLKYEKVIVFEGGESVKTDEYMSVDARYAANKAKNLISYLAFDSSLSEHSGDLKAPENPLDFNSKKAYAARDFLDKIGEDTGMEVNGLFIKNEITGRLYQPSGAYIYSEAASPLFGEEIRADSEKQQCLLKDVQLEIVARAIATYGLFDNDKSQFPIGRNCISYLKKMYPTYPRKGQIEALESNLSKD